MRVNLPSQPPVPISMPGFLRIYFFQLAISVGVVSPLLLAEEPREHIENPRFERDIVPILSVYCWSCHGGGGLAGDLDLRTVPLMLGGGKSGAAIVPGSSEESLLIQRIVKREMPPEKTLESNVGYSPNKPSEEHIELIRRWLDSGAAADYTDRPLNEDESPEWTDEDRQWWAFQSPVQSPLPETVQRDRVRTPIDTFLLKELEAKGLSFAPDADTTTLVRRLYLDLTGLPPSPEEVQAFQLESNRSPRSAFQKLVTRLLDSPYYGERWGRHWLDAAGYVDVVGADNDAMTINLHEGLWRYRDYVIQSFNHDKPFDQFVVEQLAGDELIDWRNAEQYTDRHRELITATGFLRNAGDSTNAMELNTPDVRVRVLQDTIQMVSTNVLGLTVQCAQCHTHKFDPISHVDYFRLAGIFGPALNVQNWKYPEKRYLYDVSEKVRHEIDGHNVELDNQIKRINDQIAAIFQPVRERLFEERLTALPEPIREDVRTSLSTPAEKRDEVQNYLAEKFTEPLKLTEAEVEGELDANAKQQITALRGQIGSLQSSKKSYNKLVALWESGPRPVNYLFRRGNYETPGPVVKPGVLSVLDDRDDPFPVVTSAADRPSSGYRLAFARWLTAQDHPLIARVFVNRVWQHYFGRGIVATPDNFGRSGAKPTHPELLDWLAVEFVQRGWSVKELHRLIVTSTVYRQSSHGTKKVMEKGSQVDPQNYLLWRMPLRRLESEALRDSVLAVSGKLNRTHGGPPIPLKNNPDGSVEIATEKLASPDDRFRRSIYVTARRNYHLTELNVFDQPVVRHNCTRRENSAVVLQSLAMLNSAFIFEQANYFAERVVRVAGKEDDARIEAAFRIALARPPTEKERELSRSFYSRQASRAREKQDDGQDAAPPPITALQSLCQMILNTNEFMYVQ